MGAFRRVGLGCLREWKGPGPRQDAGRRVDVKCIEDERSEK